ncbi:MAG TPA: nucleotide disphospho-sugar-binding domain-containing protein [Solirubrobacteraceae bacterium]|jgi:UDP:flavonoid glycosyltransferase YjiC (YdhE family)|nr:nucleotide disphospho-sugar-binding domain-containing protein [Solirubrobacteraceae bacterium]
MAVSPVHAVSPEDRLQPATPRLRLLLGAFGDPGHAFPMIALGRELHARGHEVTLQTWERWRAPIEAEGITFAPAPEYSAFPIGDQPLDFYEAVVYATRDTLPLVRELRPDVVVHDILTLGPSLAAELSGIARATLIPHVFPEAGPGFPIYSFGARLPRTAVGRAFWERAHLPVRRGLESGRLALNVTRAQVGLPPLSHPHGGTSRELALIATFPQLEYPRPWPAHVHVVGPLMWEPPAEEVQLPPGDAPLVLVAPSTSQDPDHRLLHAALRGLADAPVRVLATYNRRLPSRPLSVPANARVVPWVSYARTLPDCEAIVCHAGHGTLVRALSSGVPVVACPVAGDMNENAARLAWSGTGVRLPRRFVSPRPLRHAVEHALSEPSVRARARDLAVWAAAHNAGGRAGMLIERLAVPHTPSAATPSATKPDSSLSL